ncbi:hypothetical protein [Limnobacter sp.]
MVRQTTIVLHIVTYQDMAQRLAVLWTDCGSTSFDGFAQRKNLGFG